MYLEHYISLYVRLVVRLCYAYIMNFIKVYFIFRLISTSSSFSRLRKKRLEEEIYDHDDVDIDDEFFKNQQIIQEIYKV